MNRSRFVALLAGALILPALAPAPGAARAAGGASALVADAYGVTADAQLLGQQVVEIDPTPQVRVAMPPQVETATAEVVDLGPVPASGAVVGNVTVAGVEAGGQLAEGRATAIARTADVSLLEQPLLGGLVTADAVVAQANAACPGPGTLDEASAGTSLVGLRVAGVAVPLDPGPNTVITIPSVARVVVNEVIPDSDNIGFTVRGLHVFTLDPITGVATGDVVVAEAHANVVCQDGPRGPNPEDLADRDLRIDKVADGGADTATASGPGDRVSYEITVTNESTGPCTLQEVSDRLPEGFSYVVGSARGGLAEAAVTSDGDGGEIRFDVGGVQVAGGATFTGGFDAELGPNVGPGTYFDDAEVRSTCSTARTGPTAPVVVPGGPEAICVPDDLGDVAAPDVERIEGAGRIDTAIRISRCLFPDGADTVVLGRADIYADSLAGGPLAAQRRAPLLYTEPPTLNEATAIEIARLGATRAVLLGGTVALSPAVEQAVRDAGLTVERLGGANRFGTAAVVADALGSTSGQAFITEGGAATPDRGWPDAVSAAPYAGFLGDPILLVTEVSLPNETRDALEDLGIDRTVVVGGEAAVGPAVAAELTSRGHAPRRVAGANRYGTSAAVYQEGIAAGMDPQVLFLATGLDWPDALAQGPSAAALGQSFLLVDGHDLNASPETRDVIAQRGDGVGLVRIIGGPATIAPDVAADVGALVGDPDAR